MKNFIAIAGNMGIGKTTLAKRLADHLSWELSEEPNEANPYLNDFYKDMDKWAFHSQMFFLGKKLEFQYNLWKDKESVIQDRSIYEDAEVFAQNLYNQGHINERDWETYQQYYKTISNILPAPDLIIYLKASVDKVYDRIRQRERPYEKDITKKYVEDLNDLYDRWIGNFDKCPVLLISYDDMDFKYSKIDFDSFLKEIKQYIKV